MKRFEEGCLLLVYLSFSFCVDFSIFERLVPTIKRENSQLKMNKKHASRQVKIIAVLLLSQNKKTLAKKQVYKNNLSLII